ncbi:conjugal transfer protein [Enterococcus villorum]|uniref:Conjugal transfer protein n=2 Tax=Enterococcus villorum TaxID=112904 RepID=A0A511IYU5_9ENTE|nr:conjugal transfer protein [Enterococcus villorum]EOH87500.1 hypothetical protein UAO_02211 [Enterococcus villorum ATCC 700913]EOW77781.1 hypothetical protein I591_00635 [Enterococcus villorum ATCC 700913]GEL90956.1 conjugal transfer protein [Enterococcus villorum]
MNLKKIKKKEKRVKRPQIRKLSQKKANKIVFTGICLLSVASAVGVIRANMVASNFDQLDSQVRNLSESSDEPLETESTYDIVALSFYATSFAKEYLNMDTTADENKKNERLERLSNYLSIDVEAVDESTNQQLEIVRQFKEASVTKVIEEEECLLVYVYTTYEVKQKDKVETISKEMVLPIQAKDQLFSIVSRPYFLATTLPQGKTKALEPVDEQAEVSTDEKAKMEKFLKLFFEKYATAKKQELLLLMKEPIDTTDHMAFLEFNKNEVKYFKTNQKDVQGVQVSVVFIDKITGIAHTEDFSLWLSKTENSYFVNTLKHYFTEKEGN